MGDRASKEVYEAMYLQLGLDKPIWQQYLIFIGNVLQGDFGKSVMTTRPVLEDIKRFFPATLELATIATIVGVVSRCACGCSGRRQARQAD